MSNKNVHHITPKFVCSTDKPMRRLQIDAIQNLPLTPEGYQHIIVIIDTFTRWIEMYPVKELTAFQASTAIINHCGRYGFADQIVTDNGTLFINEIIEQVMLILGTQHYVTMAYSKQENAIVERSNQEVVRHIKNILFNKEIKDDWHGTLPFVQIIVVISYLVTL